MKSIVIYHSITGSTKKIARAIHDGMSQTGEQCDIARLKEVSRRDLAAYDLIGLGSPVVWRREMHNVTNFIEYTMKSVEGKHAFAFCTHGASPASYLSRVVPAMMQRGLIIIGWNDWFGSVYFPCVPKPYFTDGHPDEIDLKEAADFGREMVERSRRIYRGEKELIPAFPRGKEYDEIYAPYDEIYDTIDTIMGTDGKSGETGKRFFNPLTNNFKVDTGKCRYPKCTFCMDNCPMGAIDLSVSPPIFNVECDMCFQCEMACPQGAIEFDYEAYDKVHSGAAIEPLLKSLEIFEARGKFRRLVPMEDIGWDTPFWKFNKPRYKIA